MDKKIMYESDEAAVFEKRELEGWWSKNPKTGTEFFHGTEECLARYNGSTHRKCECGNIHRKDFTICSVCREKARLRIYLNYEVIEWDGETPVCEFDGDEYFYSECDVQNYCDDNSCNHSDLLLVLCEPQTLKEIDYDHWCDDLPENNELPDDVINALEEFNHALKDAGTVSWVPGKKRIKI